MRIGEWPMANGHGSHSANFDEKVHKPESKLYGRIGANLQLFVHKSYEIEYISASRHFGFWGTPRDPYGCIQPI